MTTTADGGRPGTPPEAGLAGSGVTIDLPTADGGRERRELRAPGPWTTPAGPLTSRVAFAAAHVVPRADADNTPGAPADVDWDSTLAFRHRVWDHGLGVADAMDTAQRGMGLDWAATGELIRRSAAEARGRGAAVACGAGTDQLDPASYAPGNDPAAVLDDVVAAYREQVALVQDAGAQVIVMASRALAAAARDPEDYAEVYDAVLADVEAPAILHWLGPMFDPALEGYWGATDVAAATNVFVDVVRAHADRIDGVKVSLLDADHEVTLRRRLAEIAVPGRELRLYTGDDFNYPELILGDGHGFSHALLGIFAAIFPAASTALQALDDGDETRARAILDSTQALGRHVFAPPTYYYKTGIAFWSWLSGFQPGFQLVGGLQSGRSAVHLVELFRLADDAGLLLDPALAAARMRGYLDVNGLS